MNKSNSSSKQSSSSNSKSRKNAKDRDKRKTQSVEINNQHNAIDIPGFPIGMELVNPQYAGISSEQLRAYAEQIDIDVLPNDVAEEFAKDLNYKLRHVIHDALIRARLSNRNTITSNDINDVFDSLGCEKVYGAPEIPSWMPFEDRLYYLEDPPINLFELADEEISLLQPADVVVTTKWIPNLTNIDDPLKNYFKIICQSVTSYSLNLRQHALQDIRENPKIGPIIDWFYHFAYLLLSNHFKNEFLTLRALDIIQAVEQNPIGGLSASENMLKFLTLLIMQKIFSNFETPVTLKPTCYTLALLCTRLPLRELIVKILLRITDSRDFNTLHMLAVLNSMGIDVIEVVFLEHMDEFLRRISENSNDPAIQHETACLYNAICRESTEASEIHFHIHNIFNNWLPIFWKPIGMLCSTAPVLSEINPVKAKVNLLKTRRKIEATPKEKKQIDITTVFTQTEHNKQIFLQARNKKMVNGNSEKQLSVEIGKTNLITSVPKFFKYKPVIQKKHCDHRIFYTI